MNMPSNPSTSSPHSERQYLHTLIAGALLPLAQSTSIAFVIAVGTWVIAWLVFDVLDPYKPALFFGIVSWVGMMIVLQWHWFQLTTIERIAQMDINRDGVIGPAPASQPEAPRRKIIIDLATVANGQYSQKRMELPGTEEQFETFARGVLNGMTMSEKTWTPEKKLYSIAVFRELMAALHKYEIAEYVSEADKRQGRRLTPLGKKYFEEVIADNSPTES